MRIEVKLSIPAPLDALVLSLARVAANQEKIIQLEAENKEILRELAQGLDAAAARAKVSVKAPGAPPAADGEPKPDG